MGTLSHNSEMFSEVGGQILLPWLTDVLIVYDLWKVSEVLHVELKAKVGMNFKNCFLIFWEHSKPTIVLFRTVKIIIMFKFSTCDFVCSMPGFPVLHYLLEFGQTHIHWVNDAIQPSHPLSTVSPHALNVSSYQGLLQWVSSLHQVAKVLEFQLQH